MHSCLAAVVCSPPCSLEEVEEEEEYVQDMIREGEDCHLGILFTYGGMLGSLFDQILYDDLLPVKIGFHILLLILVQGLPVQLSLLLPEAFWLQIGHVAMVRG